VLIAILCAYLAWDILSNRHKLDELTQIYPDTTVATPPVVNAPVDSTPVTVTPVDEPETTPVEETQPQAPIETGESCYVVVGAFSDLSNASRMMERLSSMGYIGEEIKNGALTKVAIKTTCNATTLQKTLNDARASINPEAWIY
jgi:cell division septation protein DedD